MSAQLGKCNFDGKPVDPQELDRARRVLALYGPDAEGAFCKDNVGIIYRAFHTTKESRLENQPHVSPSGAVITWDGRLDNRSGLIHELGGALSSDSTDLSIITAAYEQWGTDSFAKLIGDWAVSIWNPRTQSLVLAKDFVGTKHLYYSVEKDQVTWCTILDPLLLFAGRSFTLEEEYIAGWLSFFPAAHLTPYVGIHSVTPSSFIHLAKGKQKVSKYWDFDPGKRIRYRTDDEYEEHFRSAFSEAVRRRLRSDSPILAELSGGMDSSSIVCMADNIIGREAAATLRLDTISYYDDNEPSWNERPYFTEVEEKRGRVGCHVDVTPECTPGFELEIDGFAPTPAHGYYSSKVGQQVADCISAQGNRVVLSGVGGDEVTGGVPTPTPELADLLARVRFLELVHKLNTWALSKRQPWVHLLRQTLADFVHADVIGLPKHKAPAPWLNSAFARRNRLALAGYPRRLKLFDALPSFQENLKTLDTLRRQLACSADLCDPPCEKRYPFLDRCLIEFLYGIPREQIVRPGYRRALMRRALIGTVPNAILNRKRKASVARGPIMTIGIQCARLGDISREMVSASIGIVEPARFFKTLDDTRAGREARLIPVMRTLDLEFWLRDLREQGILSSIPIKSPARSKSDRSRQCVHQVDEGVQLAGRVSHNSR